MFNILIITDDLGMGFDNLKGTSQNGMLYDFLINILNKVHRIDPPAIM